MAAKINLIYLFNWVEVVSKSGHAVCTQEHTSTAMNISPFLTKMIGDEPEDVQWPFYKKMELPKGGFEI